MTLGSDEESSGKEQENDALSKVFSELEKIVDDFDREDEAYQVRDASEEHVQRLQEQRELALDPTVRFFKTPIGGSSHQVTLRDLALHDRNHPFPLVSLFGKVFSIRTFLNNHPGGAEILLRWAGRDATDVFFTVSAHHKLQNMIEWKLAKLQIGVLVQNDTPAIPDEESKITTRRRNAAKRSQRHAFKKRFRFLTRHLWYQTGMYERLKRDLYDIQKKKLLKRILARKSWSLPMYQKYAASNAGKLMIGNAEEMPLKEISTSEELLQAAVKDGLLEEKKVVGLKSTRSQQLKQHLSQAQHDIETPSINPNQMRRRYEQKLMRDKRTKDLNKLTEAGDMNDEAIKSLTTKTISDAYGETFKLRITKDDLRELVKTKKLPESVLRSKALAKAQYRKETMNVVDKFARISLYSGNHEATHVEKEAGEKFDELQMPTTVRTRKVSLFGEPKPPATEPLKPLAVTPPTKTGEKLVKKVLTISRKRNAASSVLEKILKDEKVSPIQLSALAEEIKTRISTFSEIERQQFSSEEDMVEWYLAKILRAKKQAHKRPKPINDTASVTILEEPETNSKESVLQKIKDALLTDKIRITSKSAQPAKQKLLNDGGEKPTRPKIKLNVKDESNGEMKPETSESRPMLPLIPNKQEFHQHLSENWRKYVFHGMRDEDKEKIFTSTASFRKVKSDLSLAHDVPGEVRGVLLAPNNPSASRRFNEEDEEMRKFDRMGQLSDTILTARNLLQEAQETTQNIDKLVNSAQAANNSNRAKASKKRK